MKSQKMSVTEYITTVKQMRKLQDGNETYSKWTTFIMKAYDAETPAHVCASRIARMAANGER